MRYLTQDEVLELHQAILDQTGGAAGVRDFDAMQSAVACPKMTFDEVDLCPTLEEKAAALAFSLICNHPFVDGNKRVGHAAMEAFLVLNGFELDADENDAERCILRVASGEASHDELANWGRSRRIPKRPETGSR